MPTQGPRFNFFQAQPGPDASRQYSDWQGAIDKQNEALNAPLRLLLQGLIESRLQGQRISAAKQEHDKTLAYEKSRDATHDAQFQQDIALRQSAEGRQKAEADYGRGQDTADLQLLLSSMMPGNSVEKLSPQAQAIQKSLSPDSMTQLFPLSQPVAPHYQAIDQAMRTMQRQQDQQAAQKAQDERTGYIKSALLNGVDLGDISKNDLPIALGHLGNGAEGESKALDMLTKGRETGKKLAGRAERFKVMETYAKEHPDDPNVKTWKPSLDVLRPGLKNGQIDDSFWDSNFEHAYGGMTGASEKAAAAASKEQKINFPGVGDVTLNTSLGRPGEYQIDAQGKPILPADADAELTALADHAVPRAVTEQGLEINAGERDAKVQARKLQFLQIAGWREKGSSSPVGAMDPFSARVGAAPDAAAPLAPAAAPQQAQPQAASAGLSNEQIIEIRRLVKEKGDDAALEYINGIPMQGSVLEKKPASKPEPPRREREPNRGPF